MPTVEGKTQAKVIKWAKQRMIPCIRLAFMPGAQVGWPDTQFLLPGGQPAFIEFKAPGKKPTLKQVEKMDLLKSQGYQVGWFDNADDAIEWLEAARRAHAQSSG